MCKFYRIKIALSYLLVITLYPTTILLAQQINLIDKFNALNLGDYQKKYHPIDSFQEAPLLQSKVKKGLIPELKDRLPNKEDILVVTPRDSIGIYGGEITFNATNPTSFGNTGFTAWDQHLMGYTTNWEVLVPEIAKSVELSSDFKSAVVTLRKGMKWSDGNEFSADDVLFWYEDIVQNQDLPNMPRQLAPGGMKVRIEKINDYQVKFRFENPFPSFALALARFSSGFPMAPQHYLEKWHIKYNKDAEAIAKEEGFNSWIDAFVFHYNGQTGQNDFDINMPVLKPWKLTRVDEFGNKFYERNPYYWKVDTEGNQLPYIDRQVRLIVSEPEVVKLKVQSGEIDYGFYNLRVEDLPILKAGEEKGNYKTILWPAAQGSMQKYQFNITVKDKILNKLFNDIRFRQAMSLAIDRNDINQTLFFGLAKPRQWGVEPTSPFYEDWMSTYYASYDPEEANRLLDEMGLKKGPDGMRVRPDGEPLTIVLWDAIKRIPLSEIVAEYWRKVGVQVTINPSTREAFKQALIANEVHASVWFADVVAEKDMYQRPIWFRPPYGIDSTPVGGGLAWREWWFTKGKKGEKPADQYFIDQMDLVGKWQMTRMGSENYFSLGKEIVKRTLERMYHIGTVGEAPEVFVRAKNLMNFPPDEGTVYINHLVSGHSDQWYLQ